MKPSYCIALAAILVGVGVLAFMGFSEDAAYFVDVAEAKSLPVEKLQGARLFGTVAEDGITRSEDGKTTVFLLEDQHDRTNMMTVRFSGVLPDAFKPGAEVIIEGSMVSEGFSAKTIMTKCPSKYQKEHRRKATS